MACFVLIAGELARQVFEGLRREASSLLIQRYFRMHIARKAYKELYASAVSIQTGMRVMAARRELHFRRTTSAAIVIQVGDALKSVYKIV
jgi:myosin-5